MFKKFKETRGQKKLKPVADILAAQESVLNEIEEKSSAIESLQDDAEKILKLHTLANDISQAQYACRRQVNSFLKSRGNNAAGWAGLSAGAATGAAIVTGGAIAGFPPLGLLAMFAVPVVQVSTANLSEKKSIKKSGKLMEREAYISYFDNIITAQESRTLATLEELEKNCDLAALSLSPHFKKVSRVSVTIHERITDAATEATKQALKEKASLKPRHSPRLVQKK